MRRQLDECYAGDGETIYGRHVYARQLLQTDGALFYEAERKSGNATVGDELPVGSMPDAQGG